MLSPLSFQPLVFFIPRATYTIKPTQGSFLALCLGTTPNGLKRTSCSAKDKTWVAGMQCKRLTCYSLCLFLVPVYVTLSPSPSNPGNPRSFHRGLTSLCLRGVSDGSGNFPRKTGLSSPIWWHPIQPLFSLTVPGQTPVWLTF